MKKQTQALVMAGLISMAGSALAEGPKRGLLEIYQQAQARDSSWAAAKSTHQATQEKLVQGRALLLPTVTLEGEAKRNKSNTEYSGSSTGNPFSGGKQYYDGYSYSLNINQPLFRMQNNLQYDQAKAQVVQADHVLNVARLDLMLRSSKTYFDVLLAQDKIDLIVAQKAATTRQLEQAKANFEVGTTTITDVHEAQSRFDLLVAQEIATINELEIKKRAIQAIISEMPGPLASAKELLNVGIPQPAEMENWVEIAEANSPQLKVQQFALDIANQEVDRAQAGHFPTLDMVASYGDSHSDGGVNGIGSDQENWTLGLQVEVPIYQGGSISSKKREAVSNQQKSKDELEQTRRSVDLQTRQAYLNVASAVAQVKAYEQALTSSQSSLDSTNLGYEVGVRTSVDVLNSQQQLFSAKRDLLQARYTWLLSVIQLKGAAGVLTEKDLAETNASLQLTDAQ
jgi:outer membrane protein